jgi:hypothetical protein
MWFCIDWKPLRGMELKVNDICKCNAGFHWNIYVKIWRMSDSVELVKRRVHFRGFKMSLRSWIWRRCSETKLFLLTLLVLLLLLLLLLHHYIFNCKDHCHNHIIFILKQQHQFPLLPYRCLKSHFNTTSDQNSSTQKTADPSDITSKPWWIIWLLY